MLSSSRVSSRALGALANATVPLRHPPQILISLSLPAESSSQALRRALALQRRQKSISTTSDIPSAGPQARRVHRRAASGYASANAAIVDLEGRDRGYDYEETSWTRTRVEKPAGERRQERRLEITGEPEPEPPNIEDEPIPRIIPLPASKSITSNLNTVELLPEMSEAPPREHNIGDPMFLQIKNSPLETLLSLRQISPSSLSSLSYRELRDLLKGIRIACRADLRLTLKYDHAQVEEAMTIVCNLLYDLPSRPNTTDRYLGGAMKGVILDQFLRTCNIVNCDDLLRKVFRERAKVQRETGTRMLNIDSLAQDLIYRHKHDLVISVLGPQTLPIRALQTKAVSFLLQAYLLRQQPFEVVRTFRLQVKEGIAPHPDSYNHLLQAHLQMGDVEAARSVMSEAEENGVDPIKQQLAVLWGYRSLNMDQNLEERVLADLDTLQMKPQADLLHALIRIRLDANDYIGADALLERFRLDLGDGFEKNGYVKPNQATYALAFEVWSNRVDYDTLMRLWRTIPKSTSIVSDTTGAIFFRRLADLGRIDMAKNVIQNTLVSGEETSDSEITRSPFQLGVRSLNAFLQCSCRRYGLDGLQDGSEMFRQAGVKPDEVTLRILVDYCSSSLIKNPSELAQLVDGLLKRNPHLKPTVQHIDTLLANAVRAGAREYQAKRRQEFSDLDQPPFAESRSAHAGLKPKDRFLLVTKRLIALLKERGATSSSRSLANRLRFDALTNTTFGSGVPSARLVWNDMIARGFKADQKHFVALMKGYSEAGIMSEVEDLMVLAQQMHVEVTNGMWMTILSGYSRLNTLNVRRAENAYKAIQSSPEGTNTIATCTMIKAYCRGKRFVDAAHLASDMTQPLLVRSGHIQLAGSTAASNTSLSHAVSTSADAGQLLDPEAVTVAAEAFRSASDFRTALNVIEAYSSLLAPNIRKVVTHIRSICTARVRNGNASPDDFEDLKRAEQILDYDVKNNKDRGRQKMGQSAIRKRVIEAFSQDKSEFSDNEDVE